MKKKNLLAILVLLVLPSLLALALAYPGASRFLEAESGLIGEVEGVVGLWWHLLASIAPIFLPMAVFVGVILAAGFGPALGWQSLRANRIFWAAFLVTAVLVGSVSLRWVTHWGAESNRQVMRILYYAYAGDSIPESALDGPGLMSLPRSRELVDSLRERRLELLTEQDDLLEAWQETEFSEAVPGQEKLQMPVWAWFPGADSVNLLRRATYRVREAGNKDNVQRHRISKADSRIRKLAFHNRKMENQSWAVGLWILAGLAWIPILSHIRIRWQWWGLALLLCLVAYQLWTSQYWVKNQFASSLIQGDTSLDEMDSLLILPIFAILIPFLLNLLLLGLLRRK